MSRRSFRRYQPISATPVRGSSIVISRPLLICCKWRQGVSIDVGGQTMKPSCSAAALIERYFTDRLMRQRNVTRGRAQCRQRPGTLGQLCPRREHELSVIGDPKSRPKWPNSTPADSACHSCAARRATSLVTRFDLCLCVFRATLHPSKVAGWRARELRRIAHGRNDQHRNEQSNDAVRH
jgi:hypothetical protein